MSVQWPLVVFTLLVCLGAGTLGTAGLLAVLKKDAPVQFLAALFSLVAIAAGGLASFFHLEHFDRAFNGFGHISSGITQELIALAVFAILAVVYLMLARRGPVPAWAGWLAVVASVAVVLVTAHSYNMAARPVWNTPLLWLYYLSNAILLGGFVLCVCWGQKVKGEGARVIAVCAVVGAALSAAALAAYLVFIPSTASSFTAVGSYFDPTHPTKAMADPAADLSGFATGQHALLFWLGAVVAGAALPLAVAVLSMKRSGPHLVGMATVGALCALAGATCFRVVLYALGYSVFVFY